MISQALFTSEQPKENKMAFVGICRKKSSVLFSPLVIQLVWYILKQSFTSVAVKVDIYLSVGESGSVNTTAIIFTSTSVNNC